MKWCESIIRLRFDPFRLHKAPNGDRPQQRLGPLAIAVVCSHLRRERAGVRIPSGLLYNKNKKKHVANY